MKGAACCEGGLRGLHDLGWWFEVREALGEVDRLFRTVEGQVQARHPTDHRLGEATRLQAERDGHFSSAAFRSGGAHVPA